MTKSYFSFYFTLKTHHQEDKLRKSQAPVDSAASTGHMGLADTVQDTAR